MARNGRRIESTKVNDIATISIAIYWWGISYRRPIEKGMYRRLYINTIQKRVLQTLN